MYTKVVNMTAKKEHWGEIQIPEGISVEVSDKKLIVRGPLGEIYKDFTKVPVNFYVENGLVKFRIYMKGKKGYALVNTIKSKLNNLFIGVQKGFTYKMKVYYVHFPMSVEVKDDEVIIKNFTGERGVRRAKIMPGVSVKVVKKGPDTELIITGLDKEAVGQTAANIHLACRTKNKDPRVFLDGIYLYYKGVGIENA